MQCKWKRVLVSDVGDSKCLWRKEVLANDFSECDNKLITKFCEIMI